MLLGPEGEPIRFRTRKHFALLIRLAVEPGKQFSRESLADLLWPDAPQRLAAHSLAQAVSVLKERVGREPVLVRRATVGLADGVVDADVHHLDACDAEIRGHFLDGFEVPAARGFEDWKDEWRAKLTPRLRDCLVRQMDAGRRIGDFTQVERHAQVLAELEPLSEDAVRGLMEARAWVGDRTTALKVYARHEERLAQELGARPSADLTRMAGLLREGRRSPAPLSPGSPPPPAAGPGAVSEAGPPPRAEKRFESETLIGREKEFAALYDNWLEVRRRAPRIVVLAGDPGVGKTTLTNAFASSCQMEGAVVARAQAYDAERELPYAVLGELIRQLTVQRAIGGAEPEALSELSRVTPEIFAVFPGVPKPVEWSAEVTPLRLADAFLKTVSAAAEESPLLLVVDDVHAVDNASAAILHIVARKLTGTRALLILAGRPTELRISGTPAALTSDSTIEGLRHLDLEPLSPEAAADLAGRLAARRPRTDRVGEPVGQADASPPTERILRASGGNPLAIELLTREWGEHGRESLLRDLEALDTLPAATLGIPRAIRTVFERQVQRLDMRTRAVLDLAAVLGRRLTDLALYAAVDCPPGEAAEALSRLLDDRFLREVQGDLEFRNELIRAQAYYGVAGKVRQQLHRRVAEVISRTLSAASDYSRLEVAWHYLRAGDAGSSVT
ncbi:MAG: ATP-binding protein, partial [Gemmatimonadales bacterium]